MRQPHFWRWAGWQIEYHPHGVQWYPLSIRTGRRKAPREWPIGRKARLIIVRMPKFTPAPDLIDALSRSLTELRKHPEDAP